MTRVEKRLRFEALLRPFARVERQELASLMLLTLNVFLLMTAYYVLKVLREPLILTGGGAEVKSYASAVQAVLLVGVVRGYDLLCRDCCRMKLMATINLFFIANLLVFFVLGRLGVPIGVPFFLWVGVFNVTIIAQFWGMANDVYTEEQGTRLFAVLGIGGSVGSVVGAQIAHWIYEPLGPYTPMLVAAAVLAASLALTYVVVRRDERRAGGDLAATPPAPVEGASATQLVFGDRYLLLIALMTLLLNWINTTGEYILDRHLLTAAEAAAAASADGSVTVGSYVGAFRGRFFTGVNIVAMILQLFVVSRVMQRFSVRVALLVTPLIALGNYGLVAVLPALPLIAVGRVAENGFGYSLQNTARHALFLVTSRQAKYKAKTLIDSFFWRAGDVLAAGLVGLGAALSFGTQQFIWINLALVLCWIALIVEIARLHRRRSALRAAPPAHGAGTPAVEKLRRPLPAADAR